VIEEYEILDRGVLRIWCVFYLFWIVACATGTKLVFMTVLPSRPGLSVIHEGCCIVLDFPLDFFLGMRRKMSVVCSDSTDQRNGADGKGKFWSSSISEHGFRFLSRDSVILSRDGQRIVAERWHTPRCVNAEA
jgi:hypothetical protein